MAHGETHRIVLTHTHTHVSGDVMRGGGGGGGRFPQTSLCFKGQILYAKQPLHSLWLNSGKSSLILKH